MASASLQNYPSSKNPLPSPQNTVNDLAELDFIPTSELASDTLMPDLVDTTLEVTYSGRISNPPAHYSPKMSALQMLTPVGGDSIFKLEALL